MLIIVAEKITMDYYILISLSYSLWGSDVFTDLRIHKFIGFIIFWHTF